MLRYRKSESDYTDRRYVNVYKGKSVPGLTKVKFKSHGGLYGNW